MPNSAAAAAAVARLHGLTVEETVHALGSAGTTTAGLWEFLSDGAMSKQLHPAKAAHDGILSVLLAQQGFTAATHILEGPKGVLAAMTSRAFPERLTDGLAPEMANWRIDGVAFKVHAACRHTHSAVDAALTARARALAVDWREDGVWMTGPTAHVFTGEFTDAFLGSL